MEPIKVQSIRRSHALKSVWNTIDTKRSRLWFVVVDHGHSQWSLTVGSGCDAQFGVLVFWILDFGFWILDLAYHTCSGVHVPVAEVQVRYDSK